MAWGLFYFFYGDLRRTKPVVLINCFSFFILISLFFYLFLFYKLPPYVIPGVLFFYYFLSLLLPDEQKSFIPWSLIWQKKLIIIAFIGLFTWSGIHIAKIITDNKKINKQFLCAWTIVHRMSDTLFVVMDNHFPMDYFSVWDAPQEFPVRNVLYRDMFLNNTEQNILLKFKIGDPRDFVNNNKVLFVGQQVASIQDYYIQRWNLPVQFSAPCAVIGCLSVTRLNKVSTK